MRNLKHTIMAVVSVSLVGTLSFFQVSDLSAQIMERDLRLSTANNIESITITDDTFAEAAEEKSEEAIQQAIAEKSSLKTGFAKVTGTCDLKAAPGDGAETIGTMSGAESLEILESTEGWYKVMVNGVSGYVKHDYVTLDKEEADIAKKQTDHYKKGKVTAQSGLMVRTSGSQDADCIGTIDCGTEVIITDMQNNYIKILYGSEYTEGYVVNTGLECTGEWVTKAEVHTAVKKAADERAAREAAAAAEAARAREAARLAAIGYSSSETTKKTSSSSTYVAPAASGKGGAIVASAQKYLGVPYVWGGTSPRGFDCSGLVQYVCKQNGISLPRTAASQRNAGKYVSRADLQPGDLVFFKSGSHISHVGIYIGGGNMIHAPQTGDVVKVSSINSTYRVNRYAGAVRVY